MIRIAYRAAAVAIFLALATVMASVSTPTKAAAAQDERAGTATFQVYKDKAEKYRWRLVTQNKNVIATSGQGYADKRGCLAGIESLKKNAASAKVEEVSAPADDHGHDHK
jgi:uncharacterized protein YegP (UPF0339 family)